MTRTIKLVLLAVACSGCSSTPYVRADGDNSVGYSEQRFGPEEYTVTYRAARGASIESAEKQLMRRVNEICKTGFTAIDPPAVPDDAVVTSTPTGAHYLAPVGVSVRCNGTD
jgi:hypothetical protein